MKRIEMYEAKDGAIFNDKQSCIKHEHILDVINKTALSTNEVLILDDLEKDIKMVKEATERGCFYKDIACYFIHAEWLIHLIKTGEKYDAVATPVPYEWDNADGYVEFG